MSLVNDVLRQLDTASSKPYPSMPLHSLVIDESSKSNNFVNIFFIILVTLLLIVLMLQLFYKQSLLDTFYTDDQRLLEIPTKSFMSNDRLVDVTMKNSPVSTPESNVIDLDDVGVGTDNEVLDADIITSHQVITDDSTDLGDHAETINVLKTKDFIEKVEEAKISKIKVFEKKVTDTNNVKKTLPIKVEPYQIANIKAVENVGFKQYQLALKAYKQKQNSMALSWVDLALATEKKDEYLRLKVRILMQKGDGDELHRFVLEQGDNTSLAWFQLIAPSLQMYSYYDLSNKYYSELIKQQPNEVKWQLAMALNFSKLGLEEKTYSIYKNLLNSSLLTYKQQKWIASRLGRMEQDRVVINE